MVSFGIGLGSFLGGVESGVGLGKTLQDTYREGKTRRELGAIDKSAKQNFNMDVEKGIRQPGDWDKFFSEYVVPKKKMALMQAGDVTGAESWQKWSDSDAARRGGKLFASSLVKAQTGDLRGAIDDSIEAAKIKGYGGDLDSVSVDEVKGEDGTRTGWKLHAKNAKGEEFTRNFTDSEIVPFIGSMNNPESAYEQYQAQEVEAGKFKKEVALNKAKATDTQAAETQALLERKRLGIGAQTTTSMVGARAQAVKELEGSTEYDDADAATKDQMITERAQAIASQAAPGLGTAPPAAPAPAGPQVRYDPRTGRILEGPLGNQSAKGNRLY